MAKKVFEQITRKSFITILVLLLIAVISITSFYIYNPNKAITLVFPDLNKITYINMRIINDSAYTKLSVILQNKNPYKLIIDTLAFNLKLNNTSIVSRTIRLNLNQGAFSVDTVKTSLNLDVKKIQGLIKNMEEQDSTTVEVIGYVVYKTIFGRVRLDYDEKARIPVPIPPKIRIVNVERKSFSYKDRILKANATIEIINKNKNLDLLLSEIHYDLTVKKTLRSIGEIKKNISIKPQTSMRIVVPMEIKVYRPLKTILLIRTDNDRLPYTLHIKGMVKENISDHTFTSPVEISATGIMELQK